MRHSPHWKRHAYDHTDDNPLAESDEDDSDDNADLMPSADEDEEEETLLVDRQAYAREQPWTAHGACAVGTCIALWCVASTCIALGPRLPYSFAAVAAVTVMSLALSRMLLLLLRSPVLSFCADWPAYLRTVVLAGALAGLELGTLLWGAANCSASMVVLGRAAAPCAQLLFVMCFGLQRRHGLLLLTMPLLSLGVAFAADDSTARWACLLLPLLFSAVFGSLRCAVLQRMLHGRDVPGLLPRRQIAQPLQLVYALAPWTLLAALIPALVVELPAALMAGSDGAAAHFRTSQASLRMPPPPPPPPVAPPKPAAIATELALLGAATFAATLLEFSIINRASALTMTVTSAVQQASMLQLAALVAGGGAIVQSIVDPINVSGLVLVFLATAGYAYATLVRGASGPGTAGDSSVSHDRHAIPPARLPGRPTDFTRHRSGGDHGFSNSSNTRQYSEGHEQWVIGNRR